MKYAYLYLTSNPYEKINKIKMLYFTPKLISKYWKDLKVTAVRCEKDLNHRKLVCIFQFFTGLIVLLGIGWYFISFLLNAHIY